MHSMFNNTQRGATMLQTIYRLPVVKAESGYSRSTIYLRIAQGLSLIHISEPTRPY